MMPLISLADGLAHARQHRYALGAFNVLDSHFLRALFAAAKQERSPFIINIAEVHFKYVSLDSLVEAVKFEAARHAIPVVLNLDHGLHYDAVVRALRLGFSSVMFDGSTLSYEENVRQMREVVKMCHAVGVSVEAELGAVGGDEGGALYGHADEAFFTDPQLAREFVDSTGIHNLTNLCEMSQKEDIQVVLSGVCEKVNAQLEKAGFYNILGKDNITDHISKALKRAEEIIEKKTVNS